MKASKSKKLQVDTRRNDEDLLDKKEEKIFQAKNKCNGLKALSSSKNKFFMYPSKDITSRE